MNPMSNLSLISIEGIIIGCENFLQVQCGNNVRFAIQNKTVILIYTNIGFYASKVENMPQRVDCCYDVK